MVLSVSRCTAFPRIEARASISFWALYTGPPSTYARNSYSDFLRVLFHTVLSSKLESNLVALSLEKNGDQCSCEPRI